MRLLAWRLHDLSIGYVISLAMCVVLLSVIMHGLATDQSAVEIAAKRPSVTMLPKPSGARELGRKLDRLVRKPGA